VDRKEKEAGISIGFDAKRAFFNRSGLGNYSRNLLSALVRYFPDNSYFLFTPKIKDRIIIENEERFRIISPQGLLFKTESHLWRMRTMVKDIKRNHLNIYHGLSQELPAGIEKSGIKSVVTVHDLIFMKFPGYYKWFDRRIYINKLIHSCRVADRIVAISKQTRNDLIDFLGIPPEKISVIYQGCNTWFRDSGTKGTDREVMSRYNLPDQYMLFVSTIEERKNLLGIIRAMHIAKIEIPLVVLGRKSYPYFNVVRKYINENKIRNIIFPGSIVNTELPAIYRNAECFLYPSFFEGFGIPIIEALVSGTPVITSRGGCFAEAGGPDTLYVDPSDPDEIGKAILKIVNDKELRKKMISAGMEYASVFRDEGIAREYIDLYHSISG
jgi:glycosyltransferase involved in cell wall biosynthesis